MSDFYPSSSSVGAPGRVRVYRGAASASSTIGSGASSGIGASGSSDQHGRQPSWDDLALTASGSGHREQQQLLLAQQHAYEDGGDGPPAADSFYRARLRESFNDVRNSYHPQRRPQQRPAPQQPVGPGGPAATAVQVGQPLGALPDSAPPLMASLRGRELAAYLQQQPQLLPPAAGVARSAPGAPRDSPTVAPRQHQQHQHPQQPALQHHHHLHVSASFGGGSSSVGRDYGYDSSTMSSKESSDSCSSAQYGGIVSSRIYRSASDQQLDRDELSLPAAGAAVGSQSRRKEYSSADALEPGIGLAVGGSSADDSFFAMLRAYHTDNVDQRAPPPPDIQRVLRGRPADVAATAGAASAAAVHQVPNVTASLEDLPSVTAARGGGGGSTTDAGSAAPPAGQRAARKPLAARTRSATELTVGGLLRRIRGGRSGAADGSSAAAGTSNGGGGDSSSRSSENSSPGDADALFNVEEKARRKAFVHFDCQSIGISFVELARHREARRNVNTTTGASAASGRCAAATAVAAAAAAAAGGSTDDASLAAAGDEPSDPGDGRSNALLEGCPYFRNELGGEQQREVALTRVTGGSRASAIAQQGQFANPVIEMSRPPICNGTSILDLSMSESESCQQDGLLRHRGYVLEYVDRGALYYRRFFRLQEHQNYFGIDENLGPIAVSIRRERGPDGKSTAFHRLIVRTSELSVMRGAILEDVVPTVSSRLSSRGVHAKDVLEYVCPDMQLSCLRLATADDKTRDQLMKLDEQGVNEAFKVGIMYCKSGQSTEEDMYNNQHSGPLLDEFLSLLGMRARLRGFKDYRGGLDNVDDTTGTHSVYASCCEGGAIDGGPLEIMFHVSTLLPFTANNRQQLLRKRHIGNDIVTIVFQEPGAPPFSPRVVRSHFQHVFIVVRAELLATSPGDMAGSSGPMLVRYKVAVSRSKDVPPFGPPVPPGATFHKPADLADFLIAKVINAENATHRSEKFVAMAVRTRREYLKDLALNYVTSAPLDNTSKLGRLAMSVTSSGKKKEKKSRSAATGGGAIINLETTCAVVWPVQLEDYTLCSVMDAYLAISVDMIAIIEMDSRDVVFSTPCSSVIGWTSAPNRLCLYYNHGECVALKVGGHDGDDIPEMVSRLARVTRGCETLEMVLRRNIEGQLGFNVHYEGVVSDVEPQGAAWRAGLISGSRLVEICKVVTATQTHDQVIDLLRTSEPVKILVIPPLRSGEPREASEEKPSRRLLTSGGSAPTLAGSDQDGGGAGEVAPSIRFVQVRRASSSSSGSSPQATLSGLHTSVDPPLSHHLPADFTNLSYHSRSDSRDSNGSQRQMRPLDGGPSPLRNPSPAALSSSLSSASFYTEYSAELQRSKMRGGGSSGVTFTSALATAGNGAAPLSLHERTGSADMTVASAEDMLSKTMPESLLRQHLRGGVSRTSAASSAGSGSAVDPQIAARRRASREVPPITYADSRAVATLAESSAYADEDLDVIYRTSATSRLPVGPELVHVRADSHSSTSTAASSESVLIPAVGTVHLLSSRAAGGGGGTGNSVNPRHSTILTAALRGPLAGQLASEDAGHQHATAAAALMRSSSYENLVSAPYGGTDHVTAPSGLVAHGTAYHPIDDGWRPRPAPRFEEPPSASNIDSEWSTLVDAATRAIDGRPGSFDSPNVTGALQSMSPSKRVHMTSASMLPEQPTASAMLPRSTNAGAATYQHVVPGLASVVYEEPSVPLPLPLASKNPASTAQDLRLEQERISALERSIEQLRCDNERLRADNHRLQVDNSRLVRTQDSPTSAAGSVYAVSNVSQVPPAPAMRTRHLL